MKIDIETRGRCFIITPAACRAGRPSVAVRMVWQVASAVSIPVLGMGGISKVTDAVEMMLAGADLVAVGTAMFTDPFAPLKVTEGIKEYLARKNIPSARELTGRVILN